MGLMNFTITERDGSTRARNGTLSLPHGEVRTPAYMPVGTNGAVKAVHHRTLQEIGYNLILANTYHLYLRPGVDIISRAGGLHRFNAWDGNILTDSGGFQVFSLSKLRKLSEEGVTFQSHLDGSLHTLSPEEIIAIQTAFGSDILMPLDVCTQPGIDREDAKNAMELTTSWGRRSYARWRQCSDRGSTGTLFGIIQGNFFRDLRERSTEEILGIGFPGIAVGGLSVGEPFDLFLEFLEFTAGMLPANIPRYVMGIGTPDYILSAVEQGIDLFDCVFATRIARNSSVLTDGGILSLKKEEYKSDFRPIDQNCGCGTCARYSRAYLRHLFKSNEILGPMAATEHNLYYLFRFLENIRRAITENRFREYKERFLSAYSGSINEK